MKRLLLALLVIASALTATPAQAATGQLLYDGTGLYPRAIRLEHSGAANGRILASIVTFSGNDGLGAIYESTNNGSSFTQVGTVADPQAAAGKGLCCATLFELPRAVGGLPAGTLLWAASVGASARPMSLRIWRSNDVGRTWSYLSSCATAPNDRGLWEPEFSVAADGRLVCHYSDETDPAHSQKLMEVRSTDGVTWTDPSPTVVSPTVGHRPGMPIVRRLPSGRYVMSYEICGLGGQYDCAAYIRHSADGWNWGSPSDLGRRVQTIDGRYFTHAPTIALAPNGKLLLVGQILQNADGSVAAGNGRTIFANTGGGNGYWYELPAPVAVTNPYNNYCPNYSSPMVVSPDGRSVLELASDYDGTVCKTYFGTGSAAVRRTPPV
ncbi:sialidase family protein [Kribbella sp.]|uniref:sialidase family protein n=1 Tax=Kribbella sp. TaxID=1871183 RepID=UPI002D474691|nr:sialidase family protein [Kribbella sp.]HZX08837.1 sialidase family protein [Kribbella sp.]